MRYIYLLVIASMLSGCSTMTKIVCFGELNEQTCAENWSRSFVEPAIYFNTHK
jgi:uncharacterized protein YceK